MKIMGILNVTPDSFSDGGRYYSCGTAIQHGLAMHAAGADILDIGGESTRPGAAEVPLDEERRRVIPVIEALKCQVNIPLSVDTYKPEVAEAALAAGASLINDVTGGADPRMRELAASSGATICMMHMQGTPRTMQMQPSYPEGVVETLLRWFEERLELLIKAGIKKEQIILDPGIGFGKSVDDNVKILHNLPRFRGLGFPLLVGVSRKSFLQKILNKTSAQALVGTVVANTLALLGGADIIRVHDVVEHRDAILLLEAMKRAL